MNFGAYGINGTAVYSKVKFISVNEYKTEIKSYRDSEKK
jgi:hypothetical protein